MAVVPHSPNKENISSSCFLVGWIGDEDEDVDIENNDHGAVASEFITKTPSLSSRSLVSESSKTDRILVLPKIPNEMIINEDVQTKSGSGSGRCATSRRLDAKNYRKAFSEARIKTRYGKLAGAAQESSNTGVGPAVDHVNTREPLGSQTCIDDEGMDDLGKQITHSSISTKKRRLGSGSMNLCVGDDKLGGSQMVGQTVTRSKNTSKQELRASQTHEGANRGSLGPSSRKDIALKDSTREHHNEVVSGRTAKRETCKPEKNARHVDVDARKSKRDAQKVCSVKGDTAVSPASAKDPCTKAVSSGQRSHSSSWHEDKVASSNNCTDDDSRGSQWVKCIDCHAWRRVPFDEDVNAKNWRCMDNGWEPKYASCDAPQEEACAETGGMHIVPGCVSLSVDLSSMKDAKHKDEDTMTQITVDSVSGSMKAEDKMGRKEKALAIIYWVKIQETGIWWPGMLLSKNKWPKTLVKKKLAGNHKVVRLFHPLDSSQEYLVVRKSLLRPFGEDYDIPKDSAIGKCFQSAVLEAQTIYQRARDELKGKDDLLKQDKDLHSKECSSIVLSKNQIRTFDPAEDHVKHQEKTPHYTERDETGPCTQDSDGACNCCGTTEDAIKEGCCSSCHIEKIPESPTYTPVSPGDMGHATNQGHCVMSYSSTAVPGLNVETGAEDAGGGGQSSFGAGVEAANFEASDADDPHDEIGATGMKLDGEFRACLNANDDHHSLCETCGQGGRLLCCDGVGCRNTYHLGCLEPPLGHVPREAWYCPDCINLQLAVYGTVDTIWDVRYDQVSTNFPTAVSCSNMFPASDVAQGGGGFEGMYFVKWKGRSHIHNSWVSEYELLKLAPKKLATFKKNRELGKALKWDPEWMEPHRVLAKRRLMKETGDIPSSQENEEWLFKWKGLGYEQCTWETTDIGALATKRVKELIKCYNKLCEAALSRSHFSRNEEKAKLRPIVDFDEQPEWIQGVQLFPHQLRVLNKLRKCYRSCTNGIVVYEASQERISSTVAFLVSIFEEFRAVRPAIIVGASDKVAVWEMELYNLASKLNCVTYVGSRDARDIIQQYEFGECLKADIVVTTFDIVNSDIDFLKKYKWEMIIVDEGSRPKASKTYLRILSELNAVFHLIFLSESLKSNIDEALQLLAFMNHGNDLLIADGADETISIGLNDLMEKLIAYSIHEFKDEACSSSMVEYWVPVQMPLVQVHEYCNLLVQNYEVLQSGHYSHQDISLHDVLLKLRECCNHPYLVSSSLQGSIMKHVPACEWLDAGIKASGKLHILDMFLCHLQSKGERVLIVTQPVMRRVTKEISLMDIFEDYLRQRFGVDSFERVESGLSVSKRQAAFQRFNAKDSDRFVLLLDRKVNNVSYRLTALDAIIIFSNDWDPSKDTSYLKKLCLNNQSKPLPIYRLYSHFSIEEGILIASNDNLVLDPNTNMKNQTKLCQQVLRWHVKCLLELNKVYDQEIGPLDTNIDISKQSLVIKCPSFDGNSMICWDPAKIRAVLSFSPDNDISRLGDPMLQAIFSTKDMPGSHENTTRSLYGVFTEAFNEDINAKEFWKLLLQERYSEWSEKRELGAHGKRQRARKKVQYNEQSDTQHDAALGDASALVLEDGRKKKRRKQDDEAEASAMQVESGCTPSERLMEISSVDILSINKDGQLPNAADIPQTAEPIGDLEANSNLRSGAYDHDGHVEKHLNPQLRQQKHLYESMMLEMASLSVALNLHESISSRANELLLYVLNNLQLKDHPSLLHAVEISLCWIAAEELGFAIDVGRTLDVSNTVLSSNLEERKVKVIFTKLSEQIKSKPSASGSQHGQPAPGGSLLQNEASSQAVSNAQTGGLLLQNEVSSQAVSNETQAQMFREGPTQRLASVIEELRKYQRTNTKRLIDSQKQQILISQQKASEARTRECNGVQNSALEMVIKDWETKLKKEQKDARERLNRCFDRLFQEINAGQVPHGEVMGRALLHQHEIDKEHENFLHDLKNFDSRLQNKHQVPNEFLAAGTADHFEYNVVSELDSVSLLVQTVATAQLEPTSSILLHDPLHPISPLGQQEMASEQAAGFTQMDNDHLEQYIPATAPCSQMFVERNGCELLNVSASIASVDGSQNLPIRVQSSAFLSNSTRAASGHSHLPRILNGVPNFAISPSLDPLRNEEMRLKKEQEKLRKAFEDQNAQIKQDYEVEVSALKKKYEARLQEEKHHFAKRYECLQWSITKVENNRRLADALRAKDAFAAAAARVEVTNGVRTAGLGTGLAAVPNPIPVLAHNGRVIEHTTLSNAELSWSTATPMLGRQEMFVPASPLAFNALALQVENGDMIGENHLSEFNAYNTPASSALQDLGLCTPGCATIPMCISTGASVPIITRTLVGAPVYTASVMTASSPSTASANRPAADGHADIFGRCEIGQLDIDNGFGTTGPALDPELICLSDDD